MADRFYSAGLVMAQLGLIDSAGVAAGTRGTAWAAGETTHNLVLAGRRSAQYTYAGAQRQPIEEGNKTTGFWEWDGDYISEVAIEMSDEDPDVDALIGATTQSATAPSSYYQTYTEEEDNAYRPLLWALLTMPAQGADGNDGTTFFFNRMFMRCKARVQSGNAEFQGGNANRRLILTPFASLTTPLGITVANMGWGLSVEKIYSAKFKSSNLVHVTSFKKDGVLTSFTTLYKPSSSSAVAATGSNLLVVNSTVTNPTSVTPATGVVVVAAGASGDKAVLLYEHGNQLV